MKRPKSPIERLPGEVAKYESILAAYWKTDVRHDPGFQRLFNGFYQLRLPRKACYEHFYRILEGLKEQERTFGQILQELSESTGRVEKSFASKALATRHPEQPIIDTWVLTFLKQRAGLIPQRQSASNRIARWANFYDKMVEWYRAFGLSSEGLACIRQFDVICPGRSVCDLKKLDFVIYITQGDVSLLKV